MSAPKHLITATIENLSPSIECGRYPVKRVPGEELAVEADVIKDGHDVIAVLLKWRMEGKRAWQEMPMTHVNNDRWRGACAFPSVGFGEFTLEVYTERWLSWQHEFTKKFEAEIENLSVEIEEGARWIEATAARAKKRTKESAALRKFAEALRKSSNAEAMQLAHAGELQALMMAFPDRSLGYEMKPQRVR